jgi:transposase-like protein
MTEDTPSPFAGPVEMDETYIGGQRKNKRLHIRRIKAKKGHGTDKLPIVGLFDRASGQVYVEVMSKKLSMPHIFKTMAERVKPGAEVFTDGFKMYRGLVKKGFRHSYVDHDGGEYVRGIIHTNNIEGFWGILKRKLSCIGGMRRERLYLFVAEIVWKFNHRTESLAEQEQQLLNLVFRFGGKS